MTRILPGAPYARRRALAGGLLALTFTLVPTALLRAIDGTSPSPRPSTCAEESARDLGIAYDPEHGATEELDALHAGILLCERARQEWVCWWEENDHMPSGLEKICGVPSQLNETLAREVKIWAIDLHPIFPDPACHQNICGGIADYIPPTSAEEFPSSPASPSFPRPLAL